jgi:hypothetical protein
VRKTGKLSEDHIQLFMRLLQPAGNNHYISKVFSAGLVNTTMQKIITSNLAEPIADIIFLLN